MHREIQIKQFCIVTAHWWPKTRNERFVWENEQYLYSFYLLYTTMSKWSECAHASGVWRVCSRALAHAAFTQGVGVNAWRRACPLVSCLRPSMCSYDGELFNLDFSVHVLFPSYRNSDLYLPLYDWQTRTVWPKNIKIGSTEEKKTPTSWMPLG